MKEPKKHFDIVAITLLPEVKRQFDAISDHRGMSLKVLLGRLIEWFAELNQTQQSTVLGQLENGDALPVSDVLAKRK